MFPTVLSANTPASNAYQISNSVRLRSAASAYFSRTYTSSATWTLSLWVKRGILGAIKPILGSSVKFNTNDTLTAGSLTTTAVYRDPSAWYNIVISNNGFYVNGVSIGAVTTSALTNSSIGSDGTNYFDGYLADINFIDGQALTPSSFGQINPTTGVWQPAKYTGSYGTNGFHLAFNNGTSTTTLGNDSSGNGNNWTPNNISLTAGLTYDWMLDSPTPYAGTSYGVGNYAVLNPLKVGSSLSLSNANLTVAASGSGIQNQAFSSILQISGKFYFEVTVATNTNANAQFGVATPLASQNTYAGQDANSWGFGFYNAIYYLYINGVQTGPVVYAGMTATGVFGVAVDVDAGKMWITDPTGAYITGNPVTGVSPLISSITNTYGLMASIGHYSVGSQTTNQSANFGQRPFSYTPPSGYKTLCTQNLPAPSIQNGANFMAATLYTGNGATQSIVNAVNGVSFQPDFVWGKLRTTSSYHRLSDSVRGASLTLATNVTDSEVSGNGLVSFDAAGFSMNSSTNINQVYPYVAWQWKAGGTAVTNTAGSITSSVSANQTAGFSVVTWTNPSSGNPTIGHGLGIAPVFVIVKSRTTAYNWDVGCTSIGWANRLILNSTSATTSGFWNSTAPTSSVFTYSASGASSSDLMVAYCFAAIPGYSAFGSYTGNGSADGPFVYCGFRPRYVMVKCSSSDQGGNADWRIQDSSRDPYNLVANLLFADLSLAESTGNTLMDLVSNGFKIRGTSTGQNAYGGTYTYAAFAESPFKYSLGR